MRSTAAPSRTMRPRRSSALTANGSIVSSIPVSAGWRTGMPKSILLIGGNIGPAGAIVRAATSPTIRLQAPSQYPFLRMQPVFSLVENHRMRPVHHLVSHFVAAMRRQAMHKNGVGLGARYQPFVDLIALEQVMAARAIALAHGNPGVGNDAVGASHSLIGIGAKRDRRTRGFDPVHQ